MRNKLVAYITGILCHFSFALAIAAMAYMLGTGLTRGIYPIGGAWGRLINLILLAQFPLLHSFLLTRVGSRVLAFPFPKKVARDLVSTSFALVSSIQLLAVFVFWTPAQTIWFAPSQLLLIPWGVLYALSWALLLKALSEAGLAMHSGWLGWRAVATGRSVAYPPLPMVGLHGQCRHPIYLSFSLIILTAPVWSYDHVLLAIVWVMYCIIGPRFKEQRIIRRGETRYEDIRQTTPYLIPRLGSLLREKRREAGSQPGN